LPPSRPVQLWFGEFIHGIMEGAYRIWNASTSPPMFPWPCNPTPFRADSPPGRLVHDIGTIGETVESSLRAQGKNPRNRAVRQSAYLRAELAVNELGPHLFPLIASAEERVIGTRQIPLDPSTRLRGHLYELNGIIDVVTHVQLNGAPANNILKRAIQEINPSLTGSFEVIIEYKGARRPTTTHPYWLHGDWQVQTYAWLRTRQPTSLPVVAGVLIYINELAPGNEDLRHLKREIRNNETDIIPQSGSEDAYRLNAWRPGDALPDLSFEFRMARAIRVIPVTETSQQVSADEFDQVVRNIEVCVANEATAGNIIQHWPRIGDDETCTACDFRHFCPSPSPHIGNHEVVAPNAP